MSELFYRALRGFGAAVFRLATTPKILHVERARRAGAYLLASNHVCAYDAPLLIVATPRVIHWLSVAKLFQNPFARAFMEAFGVMPLERRKMNATTVRTVVRLLRAGNVVGMFPEGGMRRGEDSVMQSGKIDPGICKLAQMARVPVLPCVVAGGEKLQRWTSWLPWIRARWIVAFGEPIFPHEKMDRDAAQEIMAEEITHALRALGAEVAGNLAS